MRALEDAVETTSKATTVEISATHTRKYNQLKGNNEASNCKLVAKFHKTEKTHLYVKGCSQSKKKSQMFVYSGHALSYSKLVHRHAT